MQSIYLGGYTRLMLVELKQRNKKKRKKKKERMKNAKKEAETRKECGDGTKSEMEEEFDSKNIVAASGRVHDDAMETHTYIDPSHSDGSLDPCHLLDKTEEECYGENVISPSGGLHEDTIKSYKYISQIILRN